MVLVPDDAATSTANFTKALTGVVRAGLAQHAAVISISASAGERLFTPAEVARIHRVLEQARGRHVTVVASSGDGGAVSDQGLPKQVSLPASDPMVLAVGGTSLDASYQTGAYKGEMAWNEITDATGDNSVMLPTGVVVGYPAAPGWDPVTGWGSLNAQVLVPLLAHTAHPGGAAHA